MHNASFSMYHEKRTALSTYVINKMAIFFAYTLVVIKVFSCLSTVVLGDR